MKDNICTYCDKSFGQKSHPRTHIKLIHEKMKDKTCTTCNKSFSSSTTLRMHVKAVHEKLRQYKCKYCDKSYGYSTHLSNHTKTHEDGKIKRYLSYLSEIICNKSKNESPYLIYS